NCSTCIPSGLNNIFFALDISNANGRQVQTGNVGATIASGVPEPSTWAMMLVGFAGLAMATRRRQRAIAL
ncbi:MAG: PEP-CTERM sorting domain-containing protein, partial [Alphaproteobacteria bacterium]|nr:PEP-CTERM sorting domain-containing protein [Alphaproteobacteria bacterium]